MGDIRSKLVEDYKSERCILRPPTPPGIVQSTS